MRGGGVRRESKHEALRLRRRQRSAPGPDSNRQRPPPSAGARKRLCPPGRHARGVGWGGEERGAGPRGERAPLARIPARPPRAGRAGGAAADVGWGGVGWSGRPRGARSRRPTWLGSARLGSRPSCCAGTCRTAEVWAARGAAGMGGGGDPSSPPPPSAQGCSFHSIWCCLPDWMLNVFFFFSSSSFFL